MIGQTIGRYRVVEKLGQGGMGVVYKARDTVLERFVALKVLPPGKGLDPERRQRFLNEAKAASALNHPGIVAVHDVLTVDGDDVLVMELVEGETLEQVLAGKRLPLGDALGIGVGVADALARAHAAGIVHRDLKPSNVMVGADGVKVLDFGLAKLVEAPFADPEAPTIAPDETALTIERSAVGTVGWMSPEQASGDTVDARSDVFAFGILMYEMLTGRHPFRRATATKTLAAIRQEEPERPTSLAPSLPPEVDRAVLRCLRKEPSRRWQSLSDLGAVLEGLKEDTESGRQVVAAATRKRRRVPLPVFAAMVIVVAAAAAIGVSLLRRGPAATPFLHLHRLTYDAGPSIQPSISPDGNFVAYASDPNGDDDFDIWVRHINQPEPTRLTDNPSDDWAPRFSPDGSRIVFRSGRDGGGIFIVNALGGGLRRVGPRGFFPRFSPDGAWVVYAEDPYWASGRLRRMYRVPVNGGAPEPFVTGWGIFRPPSATGPIFSPDGRFAIFKGAAFEDPRRHGWWVAPLDGGEPRPSGAEGEIGIIDVVQFPVAWRTGSLLFLAGTSFEGINLYQAVISDDGRISRPVKPLTAGPGMSWLPSVSTHGRLALDRFFWVVHLWDVPLDPDSGRPAGPPHRITHDASPKFAFSITRDGDRLVYSTYAGSPGARRTEIVLQDRVTGNDRVALTLPGATVSSYPRLSADGALLSWRLPVEGQWISYVAAIADPVGRELCRGCGVVDFFADGRTVLVDWGKRLSRIRIEDGRETPILELEEGRALLDTDLAPDDSWLAVATGEPDGSVAIWLVPIREPAAGPEDWVRIARGDGWVGVPRWSNNGRTLYFLSDRDDHICVWAQTLDAETKSLVGAPYATVHAHQSRMEMLSMNRSMWNLEVGRDRLVFNAGEITGDVYTAMLDEE